MHLSECEWEEVKPLFDGVKREKFQPGSGNDSLFDEREPEFLTGEKERDYLRLLVGRSTEPRQPRKTMLFTRRTEMSLRKTGN